MPSFLWYLSISCPYYFRRKQYDIALIYDKNISHRIHFDSYFKGTMPPYPAGLDDHGTPWLLWYSYESGDRVIITNNVKGENRATVNRTQAIRVMKGLGKTYQTMRIYLTTDDGLKTWRVAKNVRYIGADDDDTIYSTETETTIDITGGT